MKGNKRLIILTLIFLILITIVGTTKVQANLQARPNVGTLKNKSANEFFEEIRNMEAEHGTLGKNANIDPTTFLDSTNNGVDVHMAKNTEWGAVAILTASAYGQAPIGNSNASTTGNSTGVYQMADGHGDMTAGIFDTTNDNISKLRTADERYRDLYTGNSTTYAKIGDATKMIRWKGANWCGFVNQSSPIFLRGYGALFSYDYHRGAGYTYGTSRAVLVVGEGL